MDDAHETWENVEVMDTLRQITRVTSWALVGVTTAAVAVGIVAVNYRSSVGHATTTSTRSTPSVATTPTTPGPSSGAATGLQPAAPFTYRSDDASGSSDDAGAPSTSSAPVGSGDQ